MVVGATGFEPVVAAYQSRGLMRCFRPLSNTPSRKNDTIIYQKQEQGVKHQKTSAFIVIPNPFMGEESQRNLVRSLVRSG